MRISEEQVIKWLGGPFKPPPKIHIKEITGETVCNWLEEAEEEHRKAHVLYQDFGEYDSVIEYDLAARGWCLKFKEENEEY